jgi:hypothetical protein
MLIPHGQLEVPWLGLLFGSTWNFFLGLPLHALDVYGSAPKEYTLLCRMTAIRLVLLYAAIAIVGFTTGLTGVLWAVAAAAGGGSLLLYAGEYYLIKRILRVQPALDGDTAPNETFYVKGIPFKVPPSLSRRLLFFVTVCDPVNFVRDATARSDNLTGRYLHAIQVVLRGGLLALVVLVALVYPTYTRAWGCYIDQISMSGYTEGYCPAYTNDYYTSWVCASEDGADRTAGCRGDPPDTRFWTSYPPTFHVAVLLLAHLYGFHCGTAIEDFSRYKTRQHSSTV